MSKDGVVATADVDRPTILPGDRVVVVANPATRRDIGRIIASLRQAAPDDVTVDVRITGRAGEARELAREHAPGACLLVAVGGDGTVAEVASAAIEHDIPLAILPGGSTNIIARELRIPTSADGGAALVFGPHRLKAIDVGKSDRRIFLHMAGAGFDSRFFARTSSKLKRKVGWLAYLPAAGRALLDRPSEVHVRVDGQEVRAESPLVMVANGRSVAHPEFHISPDISTSDGVFDVFVITGTGPVEIFGVLGRFMTRRLDRSPYVTRLRGTHVELIADPPLPVQFDGDVDGETPVTCDILEGALRIVVPEG